ncbi:type II toxin-antitoxin system VapC family toxin [Zafaria sp. J156]|uniref:type II toxin-antitoxin system VapC family toxin n=1 Tax=Zafaria sp. J156 TaxID=3116490 RepID=UPI002E7884CE|nr:type II toxin-antitoxin system VapC family toxin [Zafaria sp. J156]MEE1620726.1 type II toxin-antitoxin system VapC family toxin [Zafaria sp. J156]
MRYLLDTNVLSDARRRASPALNAWLSTQPRADLAISVVALLELERGVLRLERRDPIAGVQLRSWLTQDVPAAFAGSILAVDERIARRTAGLHVPDPMPEMDALVAATALEHDLTLVTRNTKDFQRAGVALLDPWVL